MKPDLQFSVLCDDMRREDNGKLILIGLFEAIASVHFPLNYPGLCVINRWCNGQGSFRQRVRIVSGTDNALLTETADSPVELPATLANVTAVSLFRNLHFKTPGKYWVEVLLDADLRQRYPLMVMKIEPPPTGPFVP